MKLILIIGPQAVGKMTVGQELEKITNLKLFHNHMPIELVNPFFSYGDQTGKRLVRLIREEIFKAVSDLQKSLDFYRPLFEMIGWEEVDKNGFVSGNLKIYLKKWDYPVGNSLGVRHLCFWAENRNMVDKAGEYIKSTGVKIIRGPLIVSEYSPDYYTVDFYDPDGFMLEVAHTPDK